METLYAEISEPKQLIWIEATDHFFERGLDRLEEAVLGLG
jgi:alpha/beta superfamily hydrolase